MNVVKELIIRYHIDLPHKPRNGGGVDGMNKWKWVRGNSVVEVLPAATYR